MGEGVEAEAMPGAALGALVAVVVLAGLMVQPAKRF